ncbi:hypothetical protein PR048_008573 [Dryococelus australis]|uniref:Ig-like domain-containing protein n=1 Tax=Dryococelus australis TaxID=614101 RepID=A0ABQ9HXI3_9NEOP|nr:hypothetical protein PR048_008573 [Dryococelus australis]
MVRLCGTMSSFMCKIHEAEDMVVNMDSDEENYFDVLLLRRRRRIVRLLWMHPITVDRLKSGQFYTIMRCRKNSLDEILSLLKMHIGKADTNRRKSIPPKSLHKCWTHQSAETQHGFLQLMMQGIDSGTMVDYHQMMSAQMDTGRYTCEFEEHRMGEIRHTRLQQVLCLCSDSGEMASVEL